MGDRGYSPAIGRFLEVDPVDGGNANAYLYPVDPINMFDLDGQFCATGVASREAVGTKTKWVVVSKSVYEFALTIGSTTRKYKTRNGPSYQVQETVTKYKEHCRTPKRSILNNLRSCKNGATSQAAMAQYVVGVTVVGAATYSTGPLGAAAGGMALAGDVLLNCMSGMITDA